MGAWSPQAFDNDQALDWSGQLRGILGYAISTGNIYEARAAIEIVVRCSEIIEDDSILKRALYRLRGIYQDQEFIDKWKNSEQFKESVYAQAHKIWNIYNSKMGNFNSWFHSTSLLDQLYDCPVDSCKCGAIDIEEHGKNDAYYGRVGG